MKKIFSVKGSIPFIAAGILGFSMGVSAQTPDASPPAPSATESVPFTPQQKEALQEQVKEHMEAMTPEQKKEAREKLQKDLTPEQKKELKEKMKEKWDKMTPEQKKEARENIQKNMTPEQKAEARAKMKEKLEGMTPEERRAFFKEHKAQVAE